MTATSIPNCECGGTWQMAGVSMLDARKVPTEIIEMCRCKSCGRIMRHEGYVDTRAQVMLVSREPRELFGTAVSTWFVGDVQRSLEALATSQAWGSNLAVSNPDPASCRLLVPDHSGTWVEI